MTTTEEFNKFFSKLGELCFEIKMVERPQQPFDFTSMENQIINPHYFNEVKKKYPEAIRGFYMALHRNQCNGINCYLQKNGMVTVEFNDANMKLKKTISYPTIKEVSENKAGIIHHLTRTFQIF